MKEIGQRSLFALFILLKKFKTDKTMTKINKRGGQKAANIGGVHTGILTIDKLALGSVCAKTKIFIDMSHAHVFARRVLTCLAQYIVLLLTLLSVYNSRFARL